MSRAPQFAQALSRVGVGGSEIAAACGLSRYRTRFDLWLEKTGRAAPFAGNVYTRMGHLFEPHARQLYANRTGCDLITPATSMFHQAIPWARATPDGWRATDERHLAQIKVVGFFVGKEWKRELPIEIECQLQWEMFVTGAHTNDLAVLSGTDDLAWERFLFGAIEDPREVLDSMQFEIMPVGRLQADIDTLVDGAQRFMRMVEEDEQPPVDHSDGCRHYMDGRRGDFPIVLRGKRKGSEEIVALDFEDYEDVVNELAAAHTERKKAERRYSTAANRAREALVTAGANRINTATKAEIRAGQHAGAIIYTTDKKVLPPKAWNSEESV